MRLQAIATKNDLRRGKLLTVGEEGAGVMVTTIGCFETSLQNLRGPDKVRATYVSWPKSVAAIGGDLTKARQ